MGYFIQGKKILSGPNYVPHRGIGDILFWEWILSGVSVGFQGGIKDFWKGRFRCVMEVGGSLC